MKNIWFLLFCFLIVLNCEHSNTKFKSPINLIPENTDLLIRINSAEGLENGLKNNALIEALGTYTQIKNFESALFPLHHINKGTSFISLSKDKSDSLEISFIIPITKHSIVLDSISDLKIDSSYQTKNAITKLIYKDKHFYSTLVDSILFVSNKFDLTKNSRLSKNENPELVDLLDISDQQKMVTIFINHKKNNFYPKTFRDSTLNNLQFSNYTILDSDISQNTIAINGITKATDSTKSLINIFKNTIPQENKIASVLPMNISSFKSLTFNDYEIINQNLIRHQFQDSLSDNSDIFRNIVEIGYARQYSKDAIILRSIDPESTLDNFNAFTSNSTFRGVDIYPLDSTQKFLNHFSPLVDISSAKYYLNLDDFFIFSDDINFLKSIISDYQNNAVLSQSDSFKSLQLNLSDEASLFVYGNSSELNHIINHNFTDDKKLNLDTYKASAIQYVYDTDFAHVNAVFKTYKNKGTNSTVSEALNITLDADLISAPQLLKNHTNNQMDLVAQDTNNNLYLISNTGKVYWKKQLNGKILGDINQIDIYKNGRLQLVFNTQNRLYVLDRNGKNVGSFPLNFNDAITQPVSIFDYERKKNYRLMVTQGKSVLMYDKNGTTVTGFKYKSAKNKITSQPKHFRIGSKDYIVFSYGNQLEILDRVGRQRINVKESISFSDNEIYLYNNKFTTTNTNGELLEVDQRGIVKHKNLNVNTEHKIASTSKTLVVLNDNKLTIKSKTIELDFGNYTAPRIFYINDKIYVTVTDLQSKKGYLFDSQAKPIANFPVYANSQLELNNIDKDSSLEIITKGDNNAIIVYKFQ